MKNIQTFELSNSAFSKVDEDIYTDGVHFSNVMLIDSGGRISRYMFTRLSVKTVESIADLGVDVAIGHIKGKIEDKKLRHLLENFIEKQQKYNEICSVEEEVDFQQLEEFIRVNLLQAAGIRIFDPNAKKRGQARQEIVDAAVAHSGATTDKAKKRVAKTVYNCLDIIREFYKTQNFSLKDILIADSIVDALSEEIQDSNDETISALNTATDRIIKKIDNNGHLVSLDKAASLAKVGKLDVIEADAKEMFDHISITHPYYPLFGYDYRNGKLLSKPLTNEAQKRFPPKMTLTATVRFGDQYYNDSDEDPLKYAYRHQLPLTMEISKATKLLGEKIDPIQHEASVLEGHTVTVTPPEFPSASPCSIRTSEHTFFDYVLLRTQEILDDGTYVIGNNEQDIGIYFEFQINSKLPEKQGFKVRLKNASNREKLNYYRFTKAAVEGETIHIHVLSLDEDLLAGHLTNVKYDSETISLDMEIDFLERMCAIEEYFKVSIGIQEEISQVDYKTIVHLSDLVRNNQVNGTWNKTELTGILDHHFREELLNMDKEYYMFSYIGNVHVELFDAILEFQFMRVFKCAQIVDQDKIRKKAEILDDGDSITISLVPGEDNGIIDTLNIPDNIGEYCNQLIWSSGSLDVSGGLK